MDAQEAVDRARFHHQWLPDRLQVERYGLSPDTLAELRRRGHTVQERPAGTHQGVVQMVVHDPRGGILHGASDRRGPDGAAVRVTP
jgi:gamma-glutamyltranspeptidase/glutathione hydrolase